MNIDQLTNAFAYQVDNGATVLFFMKMMSTVTLCKHDLRKHPFDLLLTELNGWTFDPPSADNPDRIPRFIPKQLDTKE